MRMSIFIACLLLIFSSLQFAQAASFQVSQFLYSNSKNSICSLTDTNYVSCYAGFDDSSIVDLAGTDITKFQSTNPITVNLIGYSNITSDINFTSNQENTLIIGSRGDLNYEETYVKGNASNVYGVSTLRFNSWGLASLDGFNFHNLQEVILDKDGYLNILSNLDFINDNNLKVDVLGANNEFNNVAFNMSDSSELSLNFTAQANDIFVTGNTINITGNNNAKAIVNITSLDKPYSITLPGIDSNLATTININNSNLVIDDAINLRHEASNLIANKSNIYGIFNLTGSNNHVNLANSSFSGELNFFAGGNNLQLTNVNSSGEINFHQKDNTILLNNVQLSKGAAINLQQSGNKLTITNNFSGKINLLDEDNELNLQNSVLRNSTITAAGLVTLKVDNSTLSSNNTFIFNGNTSNNLSFSNSSSSANLIFNNQGNNNIVFTGTDKLNYLGGNLNIKNDSEVNLEVGSKSAVTLDYTANKAINNIILNDSSSIFTTNKTIVTNNFIQKGNSTISIDLNSGLDTIISAKNTEFNNNKILLKTYNNNLKLKANGDTTTFNLLESENGINGLQNVDLGSGLFDYKVVADNDTITVTIKKVRSISDLVNSYYSEEDGLFDKPSIVKLANYLDLLWKNENNPNITAILDYIANESSNHQTMFTFMSQLFPISNNLLFNTSYDASNAFLAEVNGYNDTISSKVWSSVFHLNNNYTLGSNPKLNTSLNGNGIAVGANYIFLPYLNAGAALGISFNHLNDYNYNMDLLNYNFVAYSNLAVAKKLHTLNSVALSVNSFDNNRTVFVNGIYDSNLSSPKVVSFIFNNEWNYDLFLVKYKNISYYITPLIKFQLGDYRLNNYSESGKEALTIKGFNVTTSAAEAGVNSVLNVNLNKAVLTSKVGVLLGNSHNNLAATVFKFKDSSLNNFVALTDFYNHKTYLKLNLGLEYTTLRQLLAVKLLFTYNASSYTNSNKISLAAVYRL